MAHSGTVDLTAPDAVAHNKLPFLSGKSQWLVCVDGSPSSWLAVDHAIRLTDPANDNILLLYIIPRNKLETLDASCFQEAEACLKRSAEAIKEADPHFLVYKSILHRKDIRKAIIKFAVERQVDYIVLGSRGLSPATSLLMGSVSQYVTEHAPCPVVVVREKTKSGGMIVDRSAVAPEKTKKKKWFFFGSDDSSSSSSSSSPSVAAPAAAAATVEASDKAVDAAAAQAKSDDQLRALVEGEAPRESDAAEAEQVERLQALAEEHRAARQSELAQQQNDGSVGRVEQEIDNILLGGEGSADASTADLKPAQVDSIEISSKLPRSAPPTLSIQSLHDSSISPVKRAMLNIPISFCFPPIPELVILDSHDTFQQALQTLSDNGIMSAPVRRHETGHIMGFFDIEDFMSYLFNLLVQEKDVDLVCTFRKKKIEVLAHKGRMPPAWIPVCERDSLYRLCQIFSTGVHRVPVTNLKGNLIGVVSQTDIIRILLQHPRLLPGDMANKLVGELDTIRKPDFILGVNDHSKAWVAMYKMLRRDLTSVPVLDEDGKLVTALTINHLKGLRSGDFHLLLSTVPKFIQKISPAGWTQVEKCLPSAPFSEVLQKLYDHSTHRVWVVDQDDKLVGLLTLTDILKYVVTIHS